MNYPRITFIGAGHMTTSLIGGLLAKNVPAEALCASEPSAEGAARTTEQYGIRVVTSNIEAVAGADVILLAVKPQVVQAVCQEIAPILRPDQLVISIAAGITCENLTSWLGERAIVRCMPNMPALIGQGASGLYARPGVTSLHRDYAEQILSAVGLALWVEHEAQMDAVTAVSGSGPAYFFLMLECMTEAGEKLGLSRETAEILAKHTARGAAGLALKNKESVAQLRHRICTAGGTTEAAVNTFLEGGFRELVHRSLGAAAKRAAQLAAEQGK